MSKKKNKEKKAAPIRFKDEEGNVYRFRKSRFILKVQHTSKEYTPETAAKDPHALATLVAKKGNTIIEVDEEATAAEQEKIAATEAEKQAKAAAAAAKAAEKKAKEEAAAKKAAADKAKKSETPAKEVVEPSKEGGE